MQNLPMIQLIDEAKNIVIKGSLCQQEGQLEEAVFYYQQALNENPNLQQVHYNLGIVFYHQGDLLEAYQSYKKAIALQPSETERFVAQLPCVRAWVVPQKNSGMINNTIAIINQDNQLVKELPQSEPGQLSGWQNCDGNKQGILELEELPELEKINGKVAVLSGLYDHVYFHWMVDILPRLEILKIHGINLEEIDRFLVNSYQQPFQRESLKILGIPQQKIILSDRHPYIQAKQFIVPSFPGDVGSVISWGLEFHRRVFFKRIKQENYTENQPSSFYPERIYISRNNSRYRRVFNEEEVLFKLSQLGFVCLQPESMTLTEKIAIFVHAKVIIADHGSVLTNIMFSPPGTQVIELVSPNYIRNYYSVISQQLGLEHYYLKGEDFGCAPIRQLMYQNPLTEDIIVNLNYLKKVLKVVSITENKKILKTVFSSESKASIQKSQQLDIKNLSQEQKNLPMEQVGKKMSLKVNSQEIATQLNQRAELYLKEKELESAKTTCEQALKHQPEYAPACKTLGNVFYTQGQLETAWYWYTKAIEYQPNFAEAYANLGTLSVRKEQWQEAISYYQKAIEIKPELPGAYLKLARACEKIDNYTEATECPRQADFFKPANQKINQLNQVIKSTSDYQIIGKILQSQEEVEAAWHSYKKGLALQPNDPEIYLNIGSLYSQQEQWIEAIQCYQKSLELNPNYAEAYRQIARAWTQIGQTTKADNCWYRAYSLEAKKATAEAKAAIDCWPKADSLEPKEVTANDHFNLGNKLYREGQITQAVSCYQKSIELNPNLGTVYYNLSVALKCLGRLDEGVIYHHKAKEIWAEKNKTQNKNNFKVSMNSRISAKLEIKNQNGHQPSTKKIKQESSQLLQLNQIVPNQRKYSQKAQIQEILKQANTYYLEGLFSEAIATCERAIKVQENPEAYQIMGKANHRKNQVDNAINCYHQALKLNPKDSGVNYEMGNILALLPGKLEEAISYYCKAIEIEPYLTEAYYSLANILVNQNQLEKVVILYEKLIKIQPNLWEPHHNLGDILIKQEKFSEAISAYGHAIELNPNSS
ncbi:MAG: tetratricopeptide repeat protein, partial [Trichodesmium sp. MAG_R03]|nr:tetratricopeptide repeat protein [Trichodesmium sp. MAG_R03]